MEESDGTVLLRTIITEALPLAMPLFKFLIKGARDVTPGVPYFLAFRASNHTLKYTVTHPNINPTTEAIRNGIAI